MPAGHVGKTITLFMMACEYDLTGTRRAYVRNIKITDPTGTTIRKSIWVSDDTFPGSQTVAFTNPGGNSLTITGRYEGVAAYANKPKPLVYGKVFNAPLYLHRDHGASGQTYHIHDGTVNSVSEVRDKGVPLTFAGYVTNTDSWTPVASNYVVQKIGGQVRLGSVPAGELTADFEGEANGGYISSTVDIVKRILTTKAGYTYPNDFDSGSLTVVNAQNSSVIGYHTGIEPVNISTVLTDLMQGIGGYWSFDRQGLIKLGRLDYPTAPSITLTSMDVLIDGVERLAHPIPAKRWRIGYQRNHTVQNATDLASSVNPATRDLLAQQFQYVQAEDKFAATLYTGAKDVESESYFYNRADAQTEADRRISIFSSARSIYRVPLTRGLFSYYIGTQVRLKIPRFLLDDGRDFVITGVTEDASNNSIVLELWG